MSRHKDISSIKRRCTNREVRDVLMAVMKSGVRYRITKKGVLFYGPHGTASTHLTPSDYRAAANLIASLRQAGIDPEGKP
jgi:hypothetical protein